MIHMLCSDPLLILGVDYTWTIVAQNHDPPLLARLLMSVTQCVLVTQVFYQTLVHMGMF